MELLKVDLLSQAKDKLYAMLPKLNISEEWLPLSEACGRITAKDVVSGEAVPAFDRSTVDGYAVRSSDTYGASESIPSFLTLVGDVAMGEAAGFKLYSGQCAYVPTGGMIPEGADGMGMIEHTENLDATNIAIYKPCAVGENINRTGEDMLPGEVILKAGRKIRPQDLAALSTLGITKVLVKKPYHIVIFSTGDELVEDTMTPPPGKIRESNSRYLRAQAENLGMVVDQVRFIKDNEDELKSAVVNALATSDFVFLSGGSSQGKKDMTAGLFDEISGGGVCTHGLALKPGKPTILGFDEKSKTVLVGLPGHPAAAAMVFDTLIGDTLKKFEGNTFKPYVEAKLTRNLASAPGRSTLMPVILNDTEEGYEAVPVLGRSGNWSILVKAQGYFEISHLKEGVRKGETVKVTLFGY